MYCTVVRTYICMYNDIYIHVHSVPYSKMYSDCIVLWMQVRWTVCTTFRSRRGPLATAIPPSSRTSWMATWRRSQYWILTLGPSTRWEHSCYRNMACVAGNCLSEQLLGLHHLVCTSPRFLPLFRCFGNYTATFISETLGL